MTDTELLVRKCDELRESFLRAAVALPNMCISLKADLSKKAMPKKLKLDCCQFCGIKFDSNTIRSRLKSRGKGKKKTVKVIVYCEGCKTDAPGVSLPKAAALKKKNVNEDTVKVKKITKVEQKPVVPVIKKSSSFPVLTHRQKQVSRSNRLSKMVAAMEKQPEPSSKTSTLDAFLSSLS